MRPNASLRELTLRCILSGPLFVIEYTFFRTFVVNISLTFQYTTQHNTTQHNATQHNTTQHNTTQRNATQHNATRHNATHRNTTHCNTRQHNTTDCNTRLVRHFSSTCGQLFVDFSSTFRHVFESWTKMYENYTILSKSRPPAHPTAHTPARPSVRPSALPIFKIFNIIKSSPDALDGLPGADRWGVIEAKCSNSFQNH